MSAIEDGLPLSLPQPTLLGLLLTVAGMPVLVLLLLLLVLTPQPPVLHFLP